MSSSRLRTLTKCVRYSKRIQSFASPKERFILSSIRPSQDQSHNQWTPPTSSIITPLAISSLTETNADVQPLNKSLDPSLENVDTTNFILSSNQALLEFIHSQLDIPWWLVIVLTTLALRTCFTLPIAIYQLKSTARLVAIQPLISSWRETLKKVIANDSRVKGLSYDAYQAVLRKEIAKKVTSLYKEHRCHPIKNLILPIVQIPLFFCNALTLRHMARERAAELGFTAGGVAWFTDLSATDSTLVLPIVIGVVGLVNGEVSSLLRPSNNSHRSKWSKYFIYFYRGMCVLSVPIAAQAPTAICVYWLTSSTYSLVQSIVFSIPSVRKKLNFPT